MKKHIVSKIDNLEISGEIVSKSIAHLEVKLNNPFGKYGLTSSSKIPYFAIPYMQYTDKKVKNDAKFLLEELYRIIELVLKNKSSLKTEMKKSFAEIKALELEGLLSEESFDQQKKELKKSLKQKQLTPVEYQKLMQPLNKKKNEFLMKSHLIIDKFFEDKIPITVPVHLRKRISKIIEQQKI